jgi:hypothetical protein
VNGIQLLQNNLKVRRRLSQLANAERRCHRTLSTYAGYHPGTVVRIKVPKSLRKLTMLIVCKEQLPVTLRLEVEQRWDSMVRHSDYISLVQVDKIRTHLKDPTSRWTKGRGAELLLQALDECVFIIQPPRSPKRTTGPRGYTDGRGSSTDHHRKTLSARRKAAEEFLQSKQNLYRENTRAQLAAATEILLRETIGENTATLQRERSAAQAYADETNVLADASQSTGSCENQKQCEGNLLVLASHVPDPSCSGCPLLRNYVSSGR